jgi:hypothetical protein
MHLPNVTQRDERELGLMMPCLAASRTYAGPLANSSASTRHEASWTISPISVSACSDETPRPDERNIGMLLSCGHRADFSHVDLAGNDLVPQPADNVGKQREPVTSLVREVAAASETTRPERLRPLVDRPDCSQMADATRWARPQHERVSQ